MIASRQQPRRSMVESRRGTPTRSTSADAIIAYDYGATFQFTGRPGNTIEDVINITPDGTFVAVAIGYGFEEERNRPLALINLLTNAAGKIVPPLPGDISLNHIPASALIEGFRVNPLFQQVVFQSQTQSNGGSGREPSFLDGQIPANLLTDNARPTLLERIKASEEISFFFSMVDSSTGRELQDEPTHNLASLGKSNGERPFRLLAQPITFSPRSTVRLQVIERTEGVAGTLFIVLYGYTALGSSVCPETIARTFTGPWQCPVETVGRPSDRIIPFDYVLTIPLSGQPRNLVDNETTVTAEGGFVATSIGYGLLVEERTAVNKDKLTTNPPLGNANTVNLNLLLLRSFFPSALIDGIRIKPNFVRLAFKDNAALATVPKSLVPDMFERLNRPEDVSFRYTIFDGGRGRELQNIPLHNVAGLGIANGERPFKRLARPVVFLPRSTIRIQVEERFGRGKLFFVFQGYKNLGRNGSGGRL